jgi:hypothetical protein
MKKRLAIAAALSLVVVAAAPASADQFYNYGARSTPVPIGSYRVVITENYPDNRTHMSYSPLDPSISAGMKARLQGSFPSVLTPCDDLAEVGCIQEVSAFVGGAWKKATSAGGATTNFKMFGTIDGKQEEYHRFDYEADEAKGLFASNKPQLWSIPGVPHELGNIYSVNVTTTNSMFGDVATMRGIDIDAWAVNNSGTQTVNLPENLRLRVKVRLGKRIAEISGWFDGRLKDANVDFGAREPGVITVEGGPVLVSTIATVDIPESDPLFPNGQSAIESRARGTGLHETAFGRDGLRTYKRVESKIQEKAVSTNTYWRLSSWEQPGNQSSCPTAKGVRGIALTNATTYDPQAPTWDSKANSLSFQVASSHLMEDGSINAGYYRLLISDAYAQCLWGANANKRSASISVLGANGETQVATTTFGGSNGWINFDAAGYHHSSPTITVKLLDETAAMPAPVPANPVVVAPKPAKKTTITCVKGKVTKKVTAVGPKCPAGYKKKP